MNQTQVQQQTAQETTVKPKQWFNLMNGNSKQVLDHINELTDGFTLLEPGVMHTIIQRIVQRPSTTFGYLQAPFDRNITDVDMVKQIIGKDGYYFKLTTTNTGVDFIWHDRVENHFLFWGEKQCVIQAMKIIQSRINLVGTRIDIQNREYEKSVAK